MIRVRSRLGVSVALVTIAGTLSAPAAAQPPVEPMPRGCLPVACAAWFLDTTPLALATDVEAAAAATGRPAVEVLIERVAAGVASQIADLAYSGPFLADIVAVNATMRAGQDVVAAIARPTLAMYAPPISG